MSMIELLVIYLIQYFIIFFYFGVWDVEEIKYFQLIIKCYYDDVIE